MSYQYLLFDFDGTLVDTSEGILKSVKYAQTKLGLRELSHDQLVSFIGPPLKESFIRYYSMTDNDAEDAVNAFREYYSTEGVHQCALYPHVDEVLNALCADQKTLFVATSKPTKFAKMIADRFKISAYFREIVGSNLDNTREKKKEVIQYILNQYPDVDKSEFVMIGDTLNDIDGAHSCGIKAIGVTYGFGTDESLKTAEALVSSICDIVDKV